MNRDKELTPVSDEDLEATFKRLSLPRAWPDDERAFRQEVRQRLGRIERLLERIANASIRRERR